jgi:hypothetical protein
MAAAKRMTYFKAIVDDKPGALLALAKNLKENNLSLIGMKGVAQGTHGDVLVIPKDPDKLRITWRAIGNLVEEGNLFFVSGADTTGALIASLESLTNIGVNVVAIEAGAVGGKFGAFLWVAPEDLDRTAEALGAQ